MTDLASGSTTIDIIIDELPRGLSGFDIDVVLGDPSIGEITAVDYNTDLALSIAPSLPASQVNLFASDLGQNISTSTSPVILATLTINPLAQGTSSIDVSLGTLGIDSDDPANIDYSITLVAGSFTVNIVPVVDAGGGATINEGDTFSDSGSFVDADNSSWTGTVDYGEGAGPETLALSGTTFSLSNTYDDNGIFSVSVNIDDGNGGIGNDTVTVTVNNVAPTIAVSGNASVDEGSTYTVNLGTVTDPGDDTVTSYIVNWGDGSSDTYSSAGDKTHTYADGDTTPTISVDLVDEDGTHPAAGTLGITVNNVAPTIAVSGNASVDEGSTYTVNLGTVTDPGDDTVTSYIVDWGDGSTAEAFGSAGDKTHIYDDGPLTPTISVDLVDEDGTHPAAGTLGITVNNVAPSIDPISDGAIDEGETYTDSGTFTDPGNDTWNTSTVDYGEGAGDQPLTISSTSTAFSLSNTYATSGSFTVTITVNDDDGGTDSITLTVVVTKAFPTLPGAVGPAQDLNFDGVAEDIDGDGELTFLDIEALFQNLRSTEVQNNQEDFDFNGNGRIDFDDIVQLFLNFQALP